MSTVADQKRLVYASILLALVVSRPMPAYADTLRYDFDKLSPWKRHRLCGGIGVGAWSISVEDGFVKVKDGGCGIGSTTGIYHTGDWADYEVKTRIQVLSLGPGGVRLTVRAVKLRPNDFGFHGSSYRIWRDNPVDIGKWYDVRIMAEGNKVTYFFDGKKVSEETISRKSGGIAFIAEMSEFWVDYVEITLPVQPQGRLITCWAKLKRS